MWCWSQNLEFWHRMVPSFLPIKRCLFRIKGYFLPHGPLNSIWGMSLMGKIVRLSLSIFRGKSCTCFSKSSSKLFLNHRISMNFLTTDMFSTLMDLVSCNSGGSRNMIFSTVQICPRTGNAESPTRSNKCCQDSFPTEHFWGGRRSPQCPWRW